MSSPPLPSDLLAKRFPISVKGVLEMPDGIVLLRNERDEWELPGGKLEEGETPHHCLERELLEELNVQARATSLLNVWLYDIQGMVDVFIVTFATQLVGRDADLRVSEEHSEVRLFPRETISTLHMPAGYKESIALYYAARS